MNKKIYFHILVITIGLSAFLFGGELSQGRTITTIKDPESLLGLVVRDLLSGVGLSYLPYLVLGWFQKTREFAIYVCLGWVLFYAWAKFFMV